MAPRKKPLPLSENTNPKPRKPRAAKKGVSVAEAPTMSLTDSERLRLRTYIAENRRFNAEASMRLLEKHALVRQLDPDNKLGLLDQSIRNASEAAARAQQQHNEVLAEVEKRLGISVQNFSFDDETGRIWPHNAEQEK